MLTPIISSERETPQAFIEFWASQTNEKERDQEELYGKLMGARPISETTFAALFKWKNGGNDLSAKKQAAVNRLYPNVSQLREGQVKDFLTQQKDAPIWTIFAVHCFYPEQFPIYDQHVYRAMAFIRNGKPKEIEPGEKIKTYLCEYLPFFISLPSAGRKTDLALWIFGRFLKQYPKFPWMG